eukprot:1119839-Pyramimonas_sp.AAC.1
MACSGVPVPDKIHVLEWGEGRSVSSKASSKDTKKARHMLGLSTPSRSSASPTGRTAAARSLLGILSTPAASKAPTARARSLLGLPRSTGAQPTVTGKAEVIDDDDVLSQDLEGIPPAHHADEVPERGSFYACPCGWSPKIEGRSNEIAQQAIARWRKCQGASPPKEPEEVKNLRHMNKSVIIRARRARSWEKYKRWHASLTEEQRPLVCTPQEDYHVVHTCYCKSIGRNMTQMKFICARCGRAQPLHLYTPKVFWASCKASGVPSAVAEDKFLTQQQLTWRRKRIRDYQKVHFANMSPQMRQHLREQRSILNK